MRIVRYRSSTSCRLVSKRYKTIIESAQHQKPSKIAERVRYMRYMQGFDTAVKPCEAWRNLVNSKDEWHGGTAVRVRPKYDTTISGKARAVGV